MPNRYTHYPWERCSQDELLDMRFCDLKLHIAGSRLEKYTEKLCQELEKKGLRFKPHFWFSTDWFTPDGIPGIAIPFYIAHPKLSQLEASQIFEVEGGNPSWLMQLLRHECGHAIDNAFQLRRKRKRQQVFGKSSNHYTDYYAPQPYSKRFVWHLDSFYAQSHPDEDFAETFAVWLTPKSKWKIKYKNWPAMKKLTLMNELMNEIKGKPPLIKTRQKVEPLSSNKRTLRSYYKKKRDYLGLDYPNFYDKDLQKLFSIHQNPEFPIKAIKFLKQVRKEVRKIVSCSTSIYQYTIDQVLEDILERVRELNLWIAKDPNQLKLEFISLLTFHTVNYIHDENHRIPR